MMRKHKVVVSVADGTGRREEVLTGRRLAVPKRFIRWLFGDFCQVLVLSPGHSVREILISEVRKDGNADEQ